MSALPPLSNASPSARPAPDDGAKRFGAIPTWAFVTSVIVTVGGAATSVWSATREIVVTCDGERMRAGDICQTLDNAGRVVSQRNHREMFEEAERLNTIIGWTAMGLVVIGVLFGVLTFVRWRQDAALASGLPRDHVPLSSHSRTATTSLILVILGAAFVGGAIYFTLSGIVKGEWPYFIGTVLCGAIGLAMLAAAIPKNGQLLQTFAEGVRIISSNRVIEVPWREVGYTITPGKGTAAHSISAPGVKSLSLAALTDHENAQRIAQQRTVEAKLGPAVEAFNRGETLDFGALSISRAGIAHGRKSLPWTAYAGIALTQGQVTVASLPSGSLTSVSLGSIRDYVLLVHVLDVVLGQRPQAAPAQP